MGEALRFAPVVARRHWRLATIHPGRGKMNQSERRKYLIQSLMDEDGRYCGMEIPADADDHNGKTNRKGL